LLNAASLSQTAAADKGFVAAAGLVADAKPLYDAAA
jgi:hypothetical protein